MMDELLFDFLMRTNHGKTMVAVGSGCWLVLEPTGSRGSKLLRLIEVQLGEDGKETFGQAVDLAGPAGQALIATQGQIISSAIAQAPDGPLYIGFSDDNGTFVVRSKSPNPKDTATLNSTDNWTAIGGSSVDDRAFSGPYVLGDLLIDTDSRLYLPYCHCRADGDQDHLGVAVWDGKWQQYKIGEGKHSFPPTGTIDAAGKLHITWSDAYQRILYTTISLEDTDAGSPPPILCGSGQQPVIACTADGRILVAFESESSHAIHYAIIEDGNVSLFEDDDFQLTHSEQRFSREMFHSPQFTVDRNGVIWLFFVNVIRRYVFACRWLGDGWGPIFEVAGIRWRPTRRDYRFLPIGRFSVPKHSLAGEPAEMAIHLQAEEPASVHSFSAVEPVKFQAKPGRKILFLDMQEISDCRGLKIVAGQAEKYEGNPILKPNPDKKAFDSGRAFNNGTIRIEDGRFRMWYSGIGYPDPSVPWWHWYGTGYAESKDGIEWERIDLGYRTGVNRNAIPGTPPVTAGLCRDDNDPDPDRRYKLLSVYFFGRRKELCLEGKLDPTDGCYHGELFTSPDGFKWKSEPIKVVNPGLKHISLIPQSLFYDSDEPDPQKRYKAYGFSSLTQGQRGVGMVYSPDAVHWTSYVHDPVMSPELRGHPHVPAGPYSHIHDVSVFKYCGYYLALYQYLYHSLAADIELTMSRDGIKFTYVNSGKKIIERGGAGAWDRGMLIPSEPIIIDDQIWLYYGGTDYHHESDGPIDLKAEDDKMLACAGLAKLRLDGFANLQLKDGDTQGRIETIPLEMPNEPLQLVLNADCGKGQIIVEVANAITGKPLAGLSFDDCVPMVTDSVSEIVCFSNQTCIENISSPLRIRLQLKGDQGLPKLYSIGFQAPPRQ